MSVSSVKMFPRRQIIDNEAYNCRYMLRDYGDYKTVQKVYKENGQWVTAAKVEEYVYWTRTKGYMEDIGLMEGCDKP